MPDITINCSDGQFDAYLALPTDDKSKGNGGILVIQEIFGVNKDMRSHCDQIAEKGYVALCPDLFWRQEPGIQLTDQSDTEWAKAFELYKGFNIDSGVTDLIITLEHLRHIDGCNGKVGTVGFCLGGFLAYKMAIESDADCNVSYYGVGIEDHLQQAEKIEKPTILHIAEEDSFVPKEAQLDINERLASNNQITIYNYAGVDHAFARNNGIHFDAAASKLADERTMKCFSDYLE